MMWIIGVELQPEPHIHTVGTYVYTKLEDDNLSSVISWTDNRGIDKFSKKNTIYSNS
jgi:hypothetical protein